ncbi:hypothetical protein ACNOYE_20480 [Nannocystaceae bacterium ST9]
MSRRLVVTLLGLFALACPASERGDASGGEATRADPESAPTRPDPTRPDPEADVAANPTWTEPLRTHLLVEGHLPERSEVEVLAIALTEPPTNASRPGPGSTRASGPSVGGGRTWPALPAPEWPGHFVARLGHGGGTRYVAVQGGPERWSLVIADLESDATTAPAIELGEVLPAALTMVGDQVVLGQGDTVAWIDLAAANPTRVELHRRPEMVGKAYDLFVRSGTWLIAIDDVVQPIWADGFRLGLGAPEHVQDFTMPSAINGSYYAGELVASGTDDGVLYLLLHYGIMDGHGHDLTALTIREGKLDVDPNVLINSSSGINPPVVEEHVDRGSGEPKTLVAGSVHTPWTNLVHVPATLGGPPRLLIGAGSRGLLELPAEFGPTSKASVIELGGSVDDLIEVAGKIYALVGVEQPLARSELVELALLPSGATVERRTALPATYQRFVR